MKPFRVGMTSTIGTAVVAAGWLVEVVGGNASKSAATAALKNGNTGPQPPIGEVLVPAMQAPFPT
jgi:hypothetical protein